MNYFDDLNPYLVRQDNQTPSPETPAINPGAIGQSYLFIILSLFTMVRV